MEYCDIGTATIAYKLTMPGTIQVVIEGSLGSCNAEWWDFCKELCLPALVYDRAGYGESSISSLSRTPENIVKELEALIEKLNITNPFIIIGHSQGGLYSTLFCLRNQNKVKGLILLDPLSTINSRFRNELTPQEYKVSGVDKTKNLKIMKTICKCGLGSLVKGLLKKSPPFYYHTYTKEAENYILKALINWKQYETAIHEYNGIVNSDNLKIFDVYEKIAKKIILITHSSEIMISEIQYYGNTSISIARKVESVWQEIMLYMNSYGMNTHHIVAKNSSHYIHLTDSDLVINEIKKIV